MKLLCIALIAVAVPIPGAAEMAGDWAGVLNFSQRTQQFVLHLSGPDTSLKATADSPGKGFGGSFVDSITLSGSRLSFTIHYLDVKFSGDVNSDGTIVGTFEQHGEGVPLVLTYAIPRPATAQIVASQQFSVTASVFHHDRSGVDFTLPDGWSMQALQTATNDLGQMAVLSNGDHPGAWASVWMLRTETHPADIQKQLDGALANKVAVRAGKKQPLPDEATTGNYSIRPGSVEHVLINGRQALRAIGEYKDPRGQAITELLLWVSTEHARAYFDLRAQAPQFETLRPAFEELIQSARIP